MLRLQSFSRWLLLSLVLAKTSMAWSSDKYDYELIVIGGGASGLFAAGSASGLFGKKTALIDVRQLGGDCTNAACVPSKALRSAARLPNIGWTEVQKHKDATVEAVRRREDASSVKERNPNLDIIFGEPRFVGPHVLRVNETTHFTSRHFILATGASPVIPKGWRDAAKVANVSLWTYQSVLRPEDDSFWNWVQEPGERKRLLIVGGGATACELGQSIGRIAKRNSLVVDLVAPGMLPSEDIPSQESALNMLLKAGIQCYLNVRVEGILPNGAIGLSDGAELLGYDGVLLCVGRSPVASLDSLDLQLANVAWNSRGVLVNPRTLQSSTAKQVYAVGDCCAAIDDQQRCASHAGWMGFHAVRNLYVPAILRLGSRNSIHPAVPRVVYTDPQIARVGLTLSECIERFGTEGFVSILVREEGSDRADMERIERATNVTFVSVQASKSGRILGCTTCGPSAAELANSVGIAMTNNLSTRDFARSVHSYPSHGYLLHRSFLSVALSDTHGLLAACGPVGKVLGSITGILSFVWRSVYSSRQQKQRYQDRVKDAGQSRQPVYILGKRRHHTEAVVLPAYSSVAIVSNLQNEETESIE